MNEGSLTCPSGHPISPDDHVCPVCGAAIDGGPPKPGGRRRRRLLLAVGLVAVLSAGGATAAVLLTGDDEPAAVETTTTTASTTTVTAPPRTTTTAFEPGPPLLEGTVAVEGYLQAIADGDYERATEFATGSAADYAAYLAALAQAAPEELDPPPQVTLSSVPDQQLSLRDDRFRIGGAATVAFDGGFRFRLSEFVVTEGDEGSWLVESYRRDRFDIRSLVVAGESGPTGDEVDVWLTYAFLQPPASGSDERSLIVTYRVVNNGDQPISPLAFGGIFTPSGSDEEFEVEFFTDAFWVAPGEMVDDAVIVEVVDADAGGVIVGVYEIQGTEETVEMQIDVPRFGRARPRTG